MIKKKTKINESNLSSKPPCPGIIWPESLILEALFKTETIVSPRNERIPNVTASNKRQNNDSMGIRIKKTIFIIIRDKKPENNPE